MSQVMGALVLVELDFQEETLALGQGLDILLELVGILMNAENEQRSYLENTEKYPKYLSSSSWLSQVPQFPDSLSPSLLEGCLTGRSSRFINPVKSLNW